MEFSPKPFAFTGTRLGLTDEQVAGLHMSLTNLPISELHHGDCIGADETAHNMAVKLGIPVVLHPPKSSKYRAFCASEKFLPPEDYIVRNHAIVNAAVRLVACPAQDYEVRRSGTWATIRYAKKQKKSIWIVWPNGNITYGL